MIKKLRFQNQNLKKKSKEFFFFWSEIKNVPISLMDVKRMKIAARIFVIKTLEYGKKEFVKQCLLWLLRRKKNSRGFVVRIGTINASLIQIAAQIVAIIIEGNGQMVSVDQVILSY